MQVNPSNNRISKTLLNLLKTKLSLTEDGVNKKLKSFRKKRGFDVTREDAALLLASLNDIDITKFADATKLKEIRELKNKEYKVDKTKTKKVEVSRTLKLKDISIISKEPFTPKKLLSDAKEMSEYYTLLYALENTLRNLIRYVFKNEPNYWKSKVNEKIREDVKFIMSKEKYFEEGRADELEYTHLDYLKQIITSNWAVFSQELNERDKTNFMREVEKFTPSRHAIAHTTKLKGLDADRCRYRFEEIMKMIK
ncbi:MAG: Swt1 family HEPN domain-containing protein [Nanoarchaeota archaeon]|nr:Swt1 family HEPN domain-containing protein [Nanoarchaeota archaeon]